MPPAQSKTALNLAPITVPTTEENPTEKIVSQEKSYWNSFYSNFTLAIPSQFCVSTAFELSKAKRPVVEFGCGNGRDSIYLASNGLNVFACDLSTEAIGHNQEKAKEYLKNCTTGSIDFVAVDATNSEQVIGIINRARQQCKGSSDSNIAVYSRFFLHSIDEEQEDAFISALSQALIAGDEIHSEYRSAEDEELPKVHGKGHYRRYIETPALLKKLHGLGFTTVYDVTGRGMAKYKDEDPYVSRFIVKKTA